jgi:hypothetical protein
MSRLSAITVAALSLLAHATFGWSQTDSLKCDVPYLGRITTIGESDLVSFTISTDEKISFIIAKSSPAGANFQPYWRLLDRNGNPAASCGTYTLSPQVDCGPLPVSGNPYYLDIADFGNDDTGDYRIHLQRLSIASACESIPLSCDVAFAGALSDPVASDLLSFNVSENEKFTITLLRGGASGANFQPFWRLLDRDGNPAASCGARTLSTQVDCGPLPVSGNPYRIEVTDFNNDDTGEYRVHLQSLTIESACENLALQCDVPISNALDDSVDNDLLSFSVSENEKFSITIVRGASAGNNFQPYWRLLDRNGNPATSCGTRTLSAQVDCGPLPTAGNPYRIQVSDFGNDDQGDYRLHFQRLTAGATCEDSPLACDVPFHGSIGNPVDADLLSFSVPTNEKVTIVLNRGINHGVNFQPYWRILDRDGNPAASCGSRTLSAQAECGPLPPSGNPYRLEITDSGNDDTGEYQVKINFQTSLCAPPPPVLASPLDSTDGVVINPATFSWSASIRATSYRLQISLGNTFATTTFDQSGITGTSFAVNTLLNDTNTIGASMLRTQAERAIGLVWNFATIISAPPPPALVSPADNTTAVPANPTLQWSVVSQIASYRVQISTTPSFSTTVIDQTSITGTIFTANGLANDVLYYWRVNATNAGGTSNWSPIWRFTTILAPPALLSPQDSASCISPNLTFAWNASPGATSYQLQVASHISFSNPEVNRSGIINTSVEAGGLSYNNAYFWRVRASNAGGASDWSSRRQFTTNLAAPLLASPADSATGLATSPTLSWNPSGGATSYRLQVSTSVSFANVIHDGSGIPGTTAAVSGLLKKTLYYWRVSASNTKCASEWSDIWRFTTLVDAPAPPELLSPPDSTIGVSSCVTLKWRKVVEAASYRIQVSTAPSFAMTFRDTSGVKADSLSLCGVARGTFYYWRVNASNEGGTSAWSPVWSFKTVPTSVSDQSAGVPTDFNLSQNYPNPFNPSTVIRYALPQAVWVKLSIFNPLGKEVATLVSEKQAPGEHEVRWQPVNQASGIYLYRLQAGKFMMTKKMILMQ